MKREVCSVFSISLIVLTSFFLVYALDKEQSRQNEPYKIIQSVDKTRNASIEVLFNNPSYKSGDRYYICINFSTTPRVDVIIRYYGWLKDLNGSIIGNFTSETVRYANFTSSCEPNASKCWDGGMMNVSASNCTNYESIKPITQGKYYIEAYYYFINFSDPSVKINPSINISDTKFYIESNAFELLSKDVGTTTTLPSKNVTTSTLPVGVI